MIIFTILLILVKISCLSGSNVGSVLFYNKRSVDCWSADDLATFRARRLLQNILLPQVTPDQINSKYIKAALRYYRKAINFARKGTDSHSSAILEDALADTIGGHLRSELLPTVRFAYYAGYVPCENARELHDFLGEIKQFLNTQGIGWTAPAKAPQWSNLTVNKVHINPGKFADSCARLIIKRDKNSCIHVPTPKLDDEREPSAIALPFKIGGLVSITSPSSENILLKYYATASRCILRMSPEECRHSDFVNFNNELWHWMKRDVAPHLLDEKLYAAFGGVFRVAAAVQSYGKGLLRRSLYGYADVYDAKWHPWRALTQSNIYINADWSPQFCVMLVVLVSLVIWALQICYGYILGKSGGCHCKGKSSKSSRDVAYSSIDSNFPAMLPSHHSQNKRVSVESKSHACVGTMKAERVYDLNENTEKCMPVIMSDCEVSEDVSLSSTSKQESEEFINNTVVEVNSVQTKRAKSPPKIETSLTQLKIDKSSAVNRNRLPMYSTSTVTRSELTYQDGNASDAWTGSISSTSDRSLSSSSSKCQTRSRSRDLNWARRVISKQSTHDPTPISTKGSLTTTTRR